MSYKRSRATFEAENHAPYAVFGTPLPDEGERDDGSYLPLWKQDVRDDKGRRRLHGAFTGGWSAGYFNTVGSKEGWTPSAFVSSRNDRRKDEPGFKPQRAEDFMDDEDMADADEARTLQTSRAFSGLGFSTQEELRGGGLMGLLRATGDTMGLRLLRRMGWKDGQGIGPKVRRTARLDLESAGAADATTYLFAPENAEMIQFVRKTDRRGLGCGPGGAAIFPRPTEGDDDEYDDHDDDDGRGANERPKAGKSRKGGFGVGILNDTGSDEEDPYEMGPKIKYNRVMGGDKKKKKKSSSSKAPAAAAAAANPSLKKAPVFTLKKTMNLRRCHDGRLPLDGFVLGQYKHDLLDVLSRYAPPPVPPGWKSAKKAEGQEAPGTAPAFVSTADAARTSTHDYRSRAAVLGEKALPGKSVFDFISAAGRDKIAAASGKTDLPPARAEALGEQEGGEEEEERRQALWERVPRLDAETAAAAMARGSRGPYADDEAKRLRYRQYLESHAAGGPELPEKRGGASDGDFLREMNEFYSCARIFKPMTGFMASRFTTAKAPAAASRDDISGGKTEGKGGSTAVVTGADASKPADPAEEAARMGMFGAMTRTVHDFYPTRLLCKRFNVKPPACARTSDEPEGPANTGTGTGTGTGATPGPAQEAAAEPEAAHEDLLRAVFGDDDEE